MTRRSAPAVTSAQAAEEEAAAAAAGIADLRARLRDQRLLRHPAVLGELRKLDAQLAAQLARTGSSAGRHRSRAAGTGQQVEDAAGFDLKPNPFDAKTPAEFVEALHRYRAWAGSPSWRKMAGRADQVVVHSTMHAAMNSDALPKLDVVKAIIIGCDGTEEDVRVFITAWRRISSGRAGDGPDWPGLLPAPVPALALVRS